MFREFSGALHVALGDILADVTYQRITQKMVKWQNIKNKGRLWRKSKIHNTYLFLVLKVQFN